MERSLGIVIPAYKPDPSVLQSYVQSLRETIDPNVIRIELDAPDATTINNISGMPADVNTVPIRRGKGAAITAGFDEINTDVLAFADADGSTPAKSLHRVIEPVRSGKSELAIGSRRHPDATVISHQTYVRRWLGHFFAWVAGKLLELDIHDFQCGAKAISQEAWSIVRNHLYEPGFAWDVELIAVASALEYNITEIPIEWTDQPGSTVAPVSTTISLARALFAVNHRVKILQNHPVHSAVDSYRSDSEKLLDRRLR